MEKLVSIDLEADFGFLRKPDTNDGIAMSYNMLHKPALLGILGAILGLDGYQRLGELPEYYRQLHSLKVGIEPLGSDKGNFPKTTVVYTNTVGYANKDGNFIAYENTLIKPSYRIYIALEELHPLYDCLRTSRSEYIPYLGKNEFPIWWDKSSFNEQDLKPFGFESDYSVTTLFCKKEGDVSRSYEAKNGSLGFAALFAQYSESFFYFERLPVGFREFDTVRGRNKLKEYQYELAPFVYSNAKFSAAYQLDNLYAIGKDEVIQLN